MRDFGIGLSTNDRSLNFFLIVQKPTESSDEERWLRNFYPNCCVQVLVNPEELVLCNNQSVPDAIIILLDNKNPKVENKFTSSIQKCISNGISTIIITGKNSSDNLVDLLVELEPDSILHYPVKKKDLYTSLKLSMSKKLKNQKKIADYEYTKKELLRKNSILTSRDKKSKSIFGQAPFGILVYDESGRLIDYNQQVITVLGVEENDIEYFSELLQYPTITNEIEYSKYENRIARYSKIIDYDELGRDNKYLLNRKGKVYLNVQITQITTEDYKYLYLVFISDETKKRLVEEQNRKLELAIKQSPNSILITDRSGTIDYVNPEFTRLTGYSFEESIGKNPSMLKSGRISKKQYENLWETILAGDVWAGEFINRKKDGTEYIENAVISPIIDEQGSITHFLGIKKDVTEIKEKERILNLLLIAIDQSPRSVVIVNTEYIIEYANKKFLTVNNCTKEQAIGGKIYDVSPFAKHLLKFDNYADQLLSGKTVNREFFFKDDNTKESWEKISISPIFNEENSITHILSIREDITDKKIIEKKLDQERKKAKRLATVKSKFLSNMSHEIRTPLNGIIGLINILINDSPRSDQAEYLQLLRFSSDHLLALINNILDLNKIDEGGLNIEKHDKDLEFMLNNLLGTYRSKASEREIELTLDYSKELNRHYFFDKTRLMQVISNLVNNALKFTHVGHVKITADLVGRRGKCDEVRISIIDSGIGIQDDKLNQIFERFVQADDSIVSDYGGSGLGLAISKKLLELMGSSIEVESKVGTGTMFSFVLKLKRGKGYDEIEGFSKKNNQNLSKSFKVLSVDDNMVNQMITQKYILTWGGEIHLANDGYEAFRMMKEQKFNLVLMDIQMPGLNGLKVTEKIRGMNDPYFKKVPIIAVSASAEQRQKNAAKRAGMNYYLTKPYHPDELKRVIVRFGKYKIDKNSLEKEDVRHQKLPSTFELDILKEQLDEFTMGDPEFKIQFIDSIIGNLKELKEEIDRTEKKRNTESLRLVHHKVKSSLMMLKQHELNNLLDQLRCVLNTKNQPVFAPTINKLNRKLDKLNINLNKIKTENILNSHI